jgi:peptide/nickel transport system substrate-binding protein
VIDSRAVRAHATRGDPGAHAWLADHLAFYGAYALAGFEPGRRLLLTANPQFGAAPAFTHVAIEAVPSPALRLSDVGGAAASHTSELDGSTFQTAAHTSGITAQAMPATAVSTLVPNERFKPFASTLVRHALSLAIDRTAIAQAAFGGFAKPATHPEPTTFAPVVGVRQPTYGQNIALARELLARAGYAHGFSFVLAASGVGGPEIGAELAAITRGLRRIGVTVIARRVGSAGDLARSVRDGSLAAALETSAIPVASVSFDIAANYLRRSPANIEAYDYPALEAVAPALTAAAPAASRAAQQRALTILGATYPVVPLVEIPTQNVTLAQIGGYAAYAAPATYYDMLRR